MGKKTLDEGFDSNSGEEGTDNNQQHSLVPDLVADDNVYITYESSAGPEYTTVADTASRCSQRALQPLPS